MLPFTRVLRTTGTTVYSTRVQVVRSTQVPLRQHFQLSAFSFSFVYTFTLCPFHTGSSSSSTRVVAQVGVYTVRP